MLKWRPCSAKRPVPRPRPAGNKGKGELPKHGVLRVRGNQSSMKRMTILTTVALALCTSAALPAPDVPCNVFFAGNCPNPIVQGVVDGQWIAVIYHYNGTNGGPDSLNIVTVGAGGNGYLTSTLQTIQPALDGDRMDAQFVGGKLWVRNAIYLPEEAHCC